MHNQMKNIPAPFMMQIENFGDMQARYQILSLVGRASAVISDVEPALTTAQRILKTLADNPKTPQAVASLRGNSVMLSRIRASEVKSVLMDDSVDLIKSAAQKLTKWDQNLRMIASGEAQVKLMKENIPEHLSVSGGSGYLALIKLVIPELAKIDKANQAAYDTMLAEIRRCTTIISDCECASELNSMVLH